MKTSTDYLASSIRIFRQYKELGEKAMNQLSDEQLLWKPEPESNSIYLIVKHLHGNMMSRWTDFLTSDGEKEWRNRDNEFEDDMVSRMDVLHKWEEGWDCLFHALEPLKPEDLSRIIKIRSEDHSVMEAVNRQVAHYSYHVGQIVFLAKMIKSADWKSLSIPKNKSKEFNSSMNHLTGK